MPRWCRRSAPVRRRPCAGIVLDVLVRVIASGRSAGDEEHRHLGTRTARPSSTPSEGGARRTIHTSPPRSLTSRLPVAAGVAVGGRGPWATGKAFGAASTTARGMRHGHGTPSLPLVAADSVNS
ncbi:hypothetical protein DCS_07318 [Drechmeria coniospora]|uniref:Uncharacterized protein n=1 Tax=Drechmeria coniospora TaxID=98403 RepID=A0A151GE40_DRECN|nr:hypothetical protein DCS_07318 [Drechmeria coniospora]KYK55355.1 hypothetical protein DCS_07318 [Drechmeria coniospora]